MTELRQSRSSRLLKIAAILVGGALLVWLSLGVTFTMTLAETNPELALRWWPWGAAPKAVIASRIANTNDNVSNADVARAEKLAREALAREPVNVEAVRSLGMLRARANRVDEADRLFAYSERLSRRDITTQLWMIERSVAKDDVTGALTHYDRALRTVPSSSDTLLPIMVSAADDPSIVPSLAKLLVPRPEYWGFFLTLAIKDGHNSPALIEFGRSLKLDIRDQIDADYAARILGRLVSDKHYAEALAYYGELTRTRAAKIGLIRDGEFDQNGKLLPFDWSLHDDSDLSAAREVYASGDNRLSIRASGGRGGEVAQELLVLRPGTYEIAGSAGNTGIGSLVQPMITLRCLDAGELLAAPLPGSDGATVKFSFAFTVPETGCGAQQLGIKTAAAVDTNAWVDGLTIRPR